MMEKFKDPWFADDTDALIEDLQDVQNQLERLDKTCSRFKIEDQTDEKQCHDG